MARTFLSGVKYKKASEDTNNLAKSDLEKALRSPDSIPVNFFANATVVGAVLWHGLKKGADKLLLDTKVVMIAVQAKSAFVVEGKAVRTDPEKQGFWKAFLLKYPGVKTGKIRKAKSDEISHFWATIPFDIEEPFWVIETANESFIANFALKDGKPQLFWIDLVSDLQKLSP